MTGTDDPSGPNGPVPSVTLTGGAAAFPIRDFLTRTNVQFVYRDGEGPVGVAICTLADGTRLESPTLAELAAHLGLINRPSLDTYDLVIVGAGPAGLAAAVYAASEGLHTGVIEREVPGGQAGTSSNIENYLGFPDGHLRRRARRARPPAGDQVRSRRCSYSGRSSLAPIATGCFAAHSLTAAPSSRDVCCAQPA